MLNGEFPRQGTGVKNARLPLLSFGEGYPRFSPPDCGENNGFNGFSLTMHNFTFRLGRKSAQNYIPIDALFRTTQMYEGACLKKPWVFETH
jgi:hypothetical protein